MKTFLTLISLIHILLITNVIESYAHNGHGHEETPSQSSDVKKPEDMPEHQFLIGSSFEVVLNSCEKDKVRLYVADRETNQPISKATITIQGSGSHNFKTEASSTQQAGEYVFNSSVKEGDKIDLKISIKEATRAETLSTLIIQWPKCIEPVQEKKHA